MAAILLALTASVAYGSSDFVAGRTARRVAPIAIAWWGHVAGTLTLTVVAALLAGGAPGGSVLFGAAGGAVASFGLVLFYGALARGPVAVVTPLAASGVAVPVVVGAFTGEAPGGLAWLGLLVAAAGVVLVASTRRTDDEPSPPCPGARPSCPDEQGARSPRLPPVAAALLAALTFGLAFVLIDTGGQGGDSGLWVAAGVQTGGLAGLLPILLGGPLARVRVPGRALGGVLAAGLLAAGGDAALAVALTAGALGVVSVLGSLDSVVSVVLALLLLRERLVPRQAAGVLGVLTGATLLAAA